MSWTKQSFAALVALCMAGQAQAYDCRRDAMLVFDASASMAEFGFGASGPTRIAEARQALERVMPEIAEIRRVGLVTYGPGQLDLCQGITHHFAPQANAAKAVIDEIRAVAPSGLTPLTEAVAQAAGLLERDTGQGIVVLLTDGSETCGGKPCHLGQAIAEAHPDITVHVIGFRRVVDPFSWNSVEAFQSANKDLNCLVDVTGGIFVETETVEDLTRALQQTLGCPVIGTREPRLSPDQPPEDKRRGV